jgi:hypothetical protein
MGGKGRLVEGNLGVCARLNEELAIDIAKCPVAIVGSGKEVPFWRGLHKLTVPPQHSCTRPVLRASVAALSFWLSNRKDACYDSTMMKDDNNVVFIKEG